MEEEKLAEFLADSQRKLELMRQRIKEQPGPWKKQLTTTASLPSSQQSSTPSQPSGMKLAMTRYMKGAVRCYQVSNGVDGPLEPAATFRIESDDEIVDHAVAPDLERAAYSTRNRVICIDRDSDLVWRYDLEPHITDHFAHYPSCAFSLDGTVVWVYRPDAIVKRGKDRLVVLRADTGEEVAREDLDTVGHSAHCFQHPDERHLLFCVGEGQDGVKVFRAALTGNGIELHTYVWMDRCLVDLAPDGRRFMTVDHGQADVTFHAFPDGEETLRLPVAAFGYHDDESFVDWSGAGFLDPDIAIATISGRTDEPEWHHHHRVDLRTGALLGRLEAGSRDADDFNPLGDGTWITSEPDGSPVRHRSSDC